jgi:hypothetical protein
LVESCGGHGYAGGEALGRFRLGGVAVQDRDHFVQVELALIHLLEHVRGD